ncbi:putative F-box domain-containing protein [Heracleum sosnowskyi]|uniref:F-box domain-containing protein n=1 Tax=Heracleum sosnowskyi TaxID=360622 RepID=A0AAD8N6K1_9APIA|nr:putative F-box domain-containing protein [Heracleum sosnowskyi]
MASRNISSHISRKKTQITDIHPEIIATHILTRIDIPSVASMALTSKQFHAVCSEDKVWTKICNSTWTSTKHPLVQNALSTFPGGHCSFFSDSFPILHFNRDDNRCHDTTPVQRAEQLISAVDLMYKDKILCSEVNVTDTSTEKNLDSIFKVEVPVDNKQSLSIPANCEDDEDMYMSDLKENMTLSWIMIDPTQKRAANISSQRPVSVRPHWIDGDIEIKFAIIISEFVEVRIMVMLKWADCGKSFVLSKLRLQLHDMDSMRLRGGKSVKILQEAIQSGKRKKARKGEETRIHQKYLDMKWERREEKQKRRRNKKKQLLVTVSVALIIVLVNLRFFVLE